MNLYIIFKKQRHYFAIKGPFSQSHGFPSGHVWMWELDSKESWERQRIDAFELWFWRRHLRVPWTAMQSNQTILKEISSEYSLEAYSVSCWSWNANILATWYEQVTYLKRPWCWERLRARGEGDNIGQVVWMVLWTLCTRVWANSEIVKDRKARHAAVHGIIKSGHNKATEQQNGLP